MSKSSAESVINVGPSSGSVISFLTELTKSLSPVLNNATTEQIGRLKERIGSINSFVQKLLDESVVNVPTGEALDQILSQRLTTLSLSTRPANCLINNAGLTTIGQLVRLSPQSVRRFRNLGDLSYAEVLGKLVERNLRLGLNVPMGPLERQTLKDDFLSDTLDPWYADRDCARSISTGSVVVFGIDRGIKTVGDFLKASEEDVIKSLVRMEHDKGEGWARDTYIHISEAILRRHNKYWADVFTL